MQSIGFRRNKQRQKTNDRDKKKNNNVKSGRKVHFSVLY